jgi:hypothetical protein
MKIRPTNKQKKLAIAMVENMNSNDPLTKKEVLASVSYGKLASQPSRVLESKGYLQALRDLGLTEELVTTSLVEDIEKKPQNRVKELALASDILQMRKPVDIDKNNDNSKGNTYNFLFNATTQQQIQDINEAIKQRLLSQ